MPGDRMPPGWRMPHRFRDGGPQWRWNDGPQPPQMTPYGGTSPGQPAPNSATPTP
jgi:hypothetical protein